MKKLLPLLLLAGCAGMPGPPGPTPALVAQGTTPNCVMWCKVIITTADAKSDVQSDGTAPITVGDQTIDLDSTVKTSKAVDIDPKP